MFEDIPKDKTKIFVTGPQRSGTRITAHILSEYLGFEYIDEHNMNLHHHWRELVLNKDRFVLQCPQHACRCHRFGFHNNVLIVYSRRSVDDIIESQKRINWGAEHDEKKKYKREFPLYFESNQGLIDKPIAEIKYYVWDNLQKMVVPSHFWYESKYEDLKESPFWVDKVGRSDFRFDQWQ